MTQERVRTCEIAFYPPEGEAIDRVEIDTAALDVVGRAELGNTLVRFRGRLVLDDAWVPDPTPGAPGAQSVVRSRLVRGIPADFFPQPGGSLEIRVDPKAFFAGADFSALVNGPEDPDGTKILVQSKTGDFTTDQVMRNMFAGLTQGSTYFVRWVE